MGPRFRVLGPVEVGTGRSAASGSPHQRALLSVLLARRGEHVRAQVLMDVLWGDRLPRTARQSLRTYVSRLRQVTGEELIGTGDGYSLQIAADDVDAGQFATLVEAARSAPADQAVELLTRALNLWRGTAFADAGDLEPVRGVARALDQARITARESLGRALVLAGRPADAVPQAEALVADEPLHEGGWAVLMDALTASGRNADALLAYRRARKLLATEGLEPSATLRDAQSRALNPQRPVAQPSPVPSAEAGPVRPPAAGAQPGLVGRDDDLAAIARLLDHAPLVTLAGTGGVGKTRLALAAAQQRAARHGSGWRLVELAAISEGSAVATAIVAALGLPGVAVGEELRSASELDVVVVLDNCEHVIDDVAAAVTTMLGSSSVPRPLRILATSRERLGVPGELTWVVEPLATRGDDSPAHRLFLDRARAARPGAVADPPAPADRAAVSRLVARLDGLPLAIEMAAAQIATLGPAELDARVADRLERRVDPLATSGRRGEPRHRTLRALIEWSQVLLSPGERAALAEWTVFAGAVTADDAVAVLGIEPDVIDVLAARSLLAVSNQNGTTRYRMLPTVRAVAAARAPVSDPGTGSDVSARVARAEARHARHFAQMAEDADRRLRTPDEAAASRRIVQVLDELRAAHAWARDHDVDLAGAMSRSLHLYGVSRLDGQVLDWAARLGPMVPNPPADARERALAAQVHASVAYRLVVAGELDAARRRAELALAQSPEPVAAMQALESLSDLAMFQGRLTDSAEAAGRGYELAEEHGDLYYGVMGRGNELLACAYGGDADAAVTLLEDAEKHYGSMDLAPSLRGWLAYFRGEVLMENDPDGAAAAVADAIALAAAGENRYLSGVARVSAVSLQGRIGTPEQALPLFAEVLDHWLGLASWSHLLTTLRNLVPVLERAGADESAVRLLGALRRPELAPSYGAELARLTQAQSKLLARMGDRFEQALHEGTADDLPAAARSALKVVQDLMEDSPDQRWRR